MILRTTRLAAAAACLWAMAGPIAAGEPHTHAHDSATATLTLDHGRKWPTDEALRRGMRAIREAVTKAPAPLHQGKAGPGEYAALGTRVEGEVGRIVANCRLPPAADAQLHLVIAELIAGVDAMKGATSAAEGRRGLLKVDGALKDYGKYFDDPAASR